MQLLQFVVASKLALAGAAILPLITTEFGSVFDVNITIGIQTFPLTVDTGSSDIYIMQTGYSCVNSTSKIDPQYIARLRRQVW